MVGTVNKVILIGRLGQNVNVQSFQNGGKLVSFSMATSERWNDKKTGEKKEIVEWHRVTVSNPNLAEVAEKYLTKGSCVYIEGQIKTRKYTDKNTNEEKSITEVVIPPIRGVLVLLDKKTDATSESDSLNDEIPF